MTEVILEILGHGLKCSRSLLAMAFTALAGPALWSGHSLGTLGSR